MITCDPKYIVPLAKATGARIPVDGQAISDVAPDGTLRSGVLFEGYNNQIVFAHIWVGPGVVPDRYWMAAIFDYPFNRLKVRKIIGQVRSNNSEACRLDEHFGFIKEAEIKDYFEDGVGLLVYTMTKDNCRVLNHKRWAKYVELAARAE